MNIDEAIAEVKFAKENGAAAVCMRPLEGDRHLSDPYFYPLYQAASDLDLSIAVHIANGNPQNADLLPPGAGRPLCAISRSHRHRLLRRHHERAAEGISQASLGLHRSLGAVGAVDLPRSGNPLLAPAAEFFRLMSSKTTKSRHLPGKTTTRLISSAARVRTAW